MKNQYISDLFMENMNEYWTAFLFIQCNEILLFEPFSFLTLYYSYINLSQNIFVFCFIWMPQISNKAHCPYMDLDGQKKATSNLPFQALEGFIQIQNKNISFKFCEGSFRKSSFCTLADLNHAIWRTLGHFLEFLN